MGRLMSLPHPASCSVRSSMPCALLEPFSPSRVAFNVRSYVAPRRRVVSSLHREHSALSGSSFIFSSPGSLISPWLSQPRKRAPATLRPRLYQR